MSEKSRAATGEYFPIPMPDGKWAVVWAHEDNDGWLRIIAEFRSEERACYFADTENELASEYILLDEHVEQPPALLPPPERRDRISAGDEPQTVRITYSQFLKDLPDLFREQPKGLTSGFVMKRYQANYNDACEVLRFADHDGKGQWVYADRSHRGKVLLPPGVEYTEWDLTTNQAALLAVLCKLADERGVVQASYVHLAKEAGIKTNGVNTILYSLEKKGYIMMAKPGAPNGSYPPIFQILKRDDEGQ